MPITQSAKKALRGSLKKRRFNQRRKDNTNKILKQFGKFVAEKNKKEAQALVPKIQQSLDKAVKTKLLKKNTASRKKSRIIGVLKKMS